MIGVCLMWKKAFNTVNHGIPIKKYLHNSVRGNIPKWFRSYIDHRKQISQAKVITFGVTQGSVLGPFYLYKILITINY